MNIKEDRSTVMKVMFEDVRRRLKLATEQGQRVYNLRRRLDEFYVNQLVWKRNYVLSDAAKYYTQKLAPKFIGPFLIKEKIAPWTYVLTDMDGNHKVVWHAKDLKPASTNDD